MAAALTLTLEDSFFGAVHITLEKETLILLFYNLLGYKET